MPCFPFVLSIFLTFFSSAVLAYISMATMIGPWIAPTLVLIASFILKLTRSTRTHTQATTQIVLIQTVGSVGGIIATAVGFTLPTLFFLDRTTFSTWLQNPLSFCTFLAITCLAAGSLGIWLARAFANKMVFQENLSFPVSHLIHKTIISQTQGQQTKSLLAGFLGTGFFCFLRDGFKLGALHIRNIIPSKDIFLFPGIFGSHAHLTLMPMLWAIGFIAGIKIAFPLLIGMFSKYLVVHPLSVHADYLPFELFPKLDIEMLTMALCSGLVMSEVLPGLLKYPAIVWNSIKNYSGVTFFKHLSSLKNGSTFSRERLLTNLEALFALVLSVMLFSYFQFPLMAQLLIITLTIIATYQISILGGKIGMVQFGRFATFVMLPTMLLFKLNPFQLTLLCIFVSICAAAATDLLFDYKIGQLCDISFDRIHRYQWLGLLTTATCLGFFFWLLMNNLQIGTSELFAQRGMSRAILIQSFNFANFNWTIVFIGFLYGLLLKKLRLSPSMVFGGILMPNALTIGLIIGAVSSMFPKNKRDHYPIFSGIFAGESLWLIVSILAKML